MPVLNPTASEELLALLNDPTKQIVAHLGQNSILDDLPTLLLADIVECNFPGYAPISDLEWLADPESVEDCARADTQTLEFVAGNIVTPQLATFVYLTQQEGSDPPKLMRYWPIPEGFLFNSAGDKYAFKAFFLNVQEA